MHETNSFQSRFYLDYNNAFGMGGENNIRHYHNVMQSIIDFYRWFKSHGLAVQYSSMTQFVHVMKTNGYFTAREILYLQASEIRLQQLFKLIRDD